MLVVMDDHHDEQGGGETTLSKSPTFQLKLSYPFTSSRELLDQSILNQMAPKRRPANVVRSGNAGNSTKPSSKTEEVIDPNIPPRPPPLFPAGYKTPVSVLNEKCQKAGWERPLVDARPNGAKWTGVVTLQKRVSKNIYELEKVRLEPRPGLEIDTAQEAKHWAATYALFRVSYNQPSQADTAN